jgi:multiple sugar transport system substrate-binding protein
VGTSWLDSLVEMDSLHPLTSAELNKLGGTEIFLPAAWQSLKSAQSGAILAAPFRADVRTIYFWKDMVEAAGLDPSQVFRSVEGMPADLQALQRVCPQPWCVPTHPVGRNTMFYVASWIWAAGGDFISPDGKMTTFAAPTALEAMRSYFELARFLPKEPALIDDNLPVQLFLERKTAAILTGPWTINSLRSQNWPASKLAQVSIAPPPGPAFVGGVGLAIWKHTRQVELALALVRHLTSTAVQVDYCMRTGMLPVRKDAWQLEPFASDPLLQALFQAILGGRALPQVSLWGTIEERLSTALGQIWSELRADPQTDLPALLNRRLAPMARRLDITLQG